MTRKNKGEQEGRVREAGKEKDEVPLPLLLILLLTFLTSSSSNPWCRVDERRNLNKINKWRFEIESHDQKMASEQSKKTG